MNVASPVPTASGTQRPLYISMRRPSPCETAPHDCGDRLTSAARMRVELLIDESDSKNHAASLLPAGLVIVEQPQAPPAPAGCARGGFGPTPGLTARSP